MLFQINRLGLAPVFLAGLVFLIQSPASAQSACTPPAHQEIPKLTQALGLTVTQTACSFQIGDSSFVFTGTGWASEGSEHSADCGQRREHVSANGLMKGHLILKDQDGRERSFVDFKGTHVTVLSRDPCNNLPEKVGRLDYGCWNRIAEIEAVRGNSESEDATACQFYEVPADAAVWSQPGPRQRTLLTEQHTATYSGPGCGSSGPFRTRDTAAVQAAAGEALIEVGAPTAGVGI